MNDDERLASVRAGMRADLNKQRQDELEVGEKAPRGGITYLPKRAPLRVSPAVQQGLITAWGAVHIDDAEAREQQGLAEGGGRSWDNRPPNQCMLELQQRAASTRNAATARIADLVARRSLSANSDGPNAVNVEETSLASEEDQADFYPPEAKSTYKETKADLEKGPCYLRIVQEPKDLFELDVAIVMDGVCDCLRERGSFRVAFQVVLFPAEDDAKFCIAAAHLKPRVHNFVDLSALRIEGGVCVIQYAIDDTKRQYSLDFKNADATEAFYGLFQLMMSDWTAETPQQATEAVPDEPVSQNEAINEPQVSPPGALGSNQVTSPHQAPIQGNESPAAVPHPFNEGEIDILIAGLRLISLSEEEQRHEDPASELDADPAVMLHIEGIFNWLSTKVPLRKDQPKLTRKMLYRYMSSQAGEILKHIMYQQVMSYNEGTKMRSSMSADWNKPPQRKCYSMTEIMNLRGHASPRPERLDKLRFLPVRKQTNSERIIGLYPKDFSPSLKTSAAASN